MRKMVLGTLASLSVFNVSEAHAKTIEYKYVTESELTIREKALMQSELTSNTVSHYDEYVMVFRPESLPKTGDNMSALAPIIGMGLILIVMRKKRVKSILLITALGPLALHSVNAISTLDTYNTSYVLNVGDELPAMIKEIPNYVFVGYIEKDVYDDAVNQEEIPPQPEESVAVENTVIKEPAVENTVIKDPIVEEVVPEVDNNVAVEPQPQPEAMPEVLQDGSPEVVIATDKGTGLSFVKSEAVITEVVQPVEKEQVENRDMFVGDTHVTSGTPGVTFTIDIDGKETVVEKAGTPEVTEVGTRPVTVLRREIIELPFEIEEVADPNAYTDEVMETPGVTGERIEDITTNEKTGEVTVDVVSETPATPQVIKRGTKEIKGRVQESVVTSIPFTEEIVEDDTLPQGHRVVETLGQDGELETVTVYETIKGVKTDTVLETTTRQLVEPIKQVVRVGTQVLKTEPIVSFKQLSEDDLKKHISVTHAVEDPTNALINATFTIYDKTTGTVVKTVTVVPGQSADVLDGLLYDTPYEIETSYTYNLGTGEVTKTLPEVVPFELEVKKIEMKHVANAKLFEVSAEGASAERSTLKVAPTNVSNYYVKIDATDKRDAYIPVNNIEEVTVEGESAYKVTAKLDELVQDRTEYHEDYVFYVRKSKDSENGIYHTFEDLVQAVKADPSGTFTIGSDLFAPESKEKYIKEFSGSLNGGDFAIHNLTAPLFEKASGTIRNLDLKHVNINSEDSFVGALAGELTKGAKIENVAVSGNVSGKTMVGGLVGKATEAMLENVSFTGNVKSPGTVKTGQNYVGGLVGRIEHGGINRGKVDANVESASWNNNQRVGGIVGSLYTEKNTGIANVYATGTVTNHNPEVTTGAVGLVGSIWQNGTLKNAVTNMKVTNGVHINSDIADTRARIDRKTVFHTPEATATATDSWSKADANALDKVATFGLDAQVSPDKNLKIYETGYHVDYAKVDHYDATRETAYRNMEKLIPLFNKETIVKYGNRVNGDLATKLVKSVTPMKNGQVVTHIDAPDDVDTILVHFEDDTVVKKSVAFKEVFKNTGVLEYTIDNVIYTPEQLIGQYDDIVNRVVPALQSVVYHAEETAHKIGKVATDQQIADHAKNEKVDLAEGRVRWYRERMDELYLKPTIDAIKAKMPEYVRQLLATDASINTSDGAIADAMVHKIISNKENLLFGLAYMQRWYNINFADMNVRDLMTYHQDFNGLPVSTIDFLIALGKNYDSVKAANNLATYVDHIKRNNGEDSILDFYTDFRKKFTTYKDDQEWFKNTSTLMYSENPSRVIPDYDVSVWRKLTVGDYEKKHILPLLTADKGVYAITSMNGIMFGGIDTYHKDRAALTDADWVKFQETIDKVGVWHRDYFDFWYRIANDDVKEKIKQNIHTWDAKGSSPWTGDTISETVSDFIGPIGMRWAMNGSAAYANGSATFFVAYSALNQGGQVVYTHEATHNMDGRAYLGKYGRRTPSGAEMYARGLLETAGSSDQGVIGLNMTFDWSEDRKNAVKSQAMVHNATPDRFKNEADTNEYLRRAFDVIYSLDILEAEYALENDKVGQLFNQMTTTHDGWLAQMTRGEIADTSVIRTLDDFVEHDLISYRYQRGNTDGYKLAENGYWHVTLAAPIFGTGTGPKGVAGDLLYRRMAWEAWGNGGYTDGFLNYASNKLKADPKGPNVTDDMVATAISGGQHTTMKALKKSWIKERADKLTQLKPITFTMDNKQYVIKNSEDLRALINKTLENDLAKKRTDISKLKNHIFAAYLRETDEFRQDVYQ